MPIFIYDLRSDELERLQYGPKEIFGLTGVNGKTVREWRSRGLAPFGQQQANSYWLYSLYDAVALAIADRLVKIGMPLKWSLDASWDCAPFIAYHIKDGGPERSGTMLYLSDWRPGERPEEEAAIVSTLSVAGVADHAELTAVRNRRAGSELAHVLYIADLIKKLPPELIDEVRNSNV